MAVLNRTAEELHNIVGYEDAAHVLYVMDGEGIQPGSFTMALIEAMAKADTMNLMKLGQVYPGLAAAVDAYQRADYGLVTLQEIARRFDGTSRTVTAE